MRTNKNAFYLGAEIVASHFPFGERFYFLMIKKWSFSTQNEEGIGWKKKGKPLQDDTIQPTVKFGGGSIMVWGWMMGDQKGDLVLVDGILEQKQMKKILENHAIPSGLRLYTIQD